MWLWPPRGAFAWSGRPDNMVAMQIAGSLRAINNTFGNQRVAEKTRRSKKKKVPSLTVVTTVVGGHSWATLHSCPYPCRARTCSMVVGGKSWICMGTSWASGRLTSFAFCSASSFSLGVILCMGRKACGERCGWRRAATAGGN